MLLIDENEPYQIEQLVAQSVPTSRAPLNQRGFADYLWHNQLGEIEQVERKQVGELLSKLEATEYQLLQERENKATLMLFLEGWAEPHPDGTQIWVPTKDGKLMRPGHIYRIPYAKYEGWLIGLEKAGVLVWKTYTWIGTANALVLWYKSAERGEHFTLNRHLPQKQVFHPDPHVQNLISVWKGGFGETLAIAAIEIFKTYWDVIRQPPEMLAEWIPGVGLDKAKQLLRAVGRKDV